MSPSPPSLSVVIPTKNRALVLELTLDALEHQRDIPVDGFEVIVADDGSSDDTPQLVARRRFSFPFRYVPLTPGGPARARNRAIAVAAGLRVLLLGDDTIPLPETLARHLSAAGGREVGVQGLVEWDPREEISPVMRFLAPEGPQFYFKGLRPEQPIPYSAVLGANLSAPTDWFRDEPFDEGFPAAAFEDTELAYRWSLKGRQVIFFPSAVCWHRHRYDSLRPFLDRQQRAGRAARYAIRKHPRLLGETVLKPSLVGARNAICHAALALAGRARQSSAWDLQVRTAFLRGFFGAKPRPVGADPAAD